MDSTCAFILNSLYHKQKSEGQYNDGSILVVGNKNICLIRVPTVDPNQYWVYDRSCNLRYKIPDCVLPGVLEKFGGCATITDVSSAQLDAINRSYNLITVIEKTADDTKCVMHYDKQLNYTDNGKLNIIPLNSESYTIIFDKKIGPSWLDNKP